MDFYNKGYIIFIKLLISPVFFSHRPDQQLAAGEAAQAVHGGQESAALLAAGQADVPGSPDPGNPGGWWSVSDPRGG